MSFELDFGMGFRWWFEGGMNDDLNFLEWVYI
jgi:hypothetical protein